MQQNSPLTQILYLNQRVEFKVNIADYYIRALYSSICLAWYHNDTRITINERINITDGGTTLTIAGTVETDAGKYQVRIDSMNFPWGADVSECHSVLLLFEKLAFHAPVVFQIQQTAAPEYNLEDIITQ